MARTGGLIPWILLCGVSVAQAQSGPVFDVASVKPVALDLLETRPTRTGGRITWTADLHYLIGYAWNIPLPFLSGTIPGSASIFRVEATMDPTASEDQVRLMMQSLLSERFKLVAHHVTKETDGYALTVGKNGLKIKEAKAGKPPPIPEGLRKESSAALDGIVAATIPEVGVIAITGRRVSIAKLVETLKRVLGGTMVWDKTGVPGDYYFSFRYARDDNPETDAPSLATALRENLGLELKKDKGLVELLVVDSIEKAPTEN